MADLLGGKVMTKQEAIEAINAEIQVAEKMYANQRDLHTPQANLTMYGCSWKLEGLKAALQIVKALDE